METKKAVEILEHFLSSFYEYPDWSYLGEATVDAIEELIRFTKEKGEHSYDYKYHC